MTANQIRGILEPLFVEYPVKFTVYRKPSYSCLFHTKRIPAKALKCKGIPTTVWCGKRGIIIHFKKCFINRKYFGKAAFFSKDIRWQYLPIDWINISDLLFRKLESGQKAVSGYAAINREL